MLENLTKILIRPKKWLNLGDQILADCKNKVGVRNTYCWAKIIF
jgi:hypothetical protein